MSGLLIIGAGGHGKVVADTAFETGRWEKIAFLDDRHPELASTLVWPVLGRINQAHDFLSEYSDVIVAIGDNLLRVELSRRLSDLGYHLTNVVHPLAFVSKNAALDAGIVIFAMTAVNAGTKIGMGSIINTGATVDHDCVLGDGVHLSPGVHLSGEVRIGNYSWLGTGTNVNNHVTIGENVITGSGSAIISDIEDNVTVTGVPGRVMKKNG